MAKIHGGKEFEAMSETEADNNSIFLDSSDNVLKQKDNSGYVKVLGGEYEQTGPYGIFPSSLNTITNNTEDNITTLTYNLNVACAPLVHSYCYKNGINWTMSTVLNAIGISKESFYLSSDNDEYLIMQFADTVIPANTDFTITETINTVNDDGQSSTTKFSILFGDVGYSDYDIELRYETGALSERTADPTTFFDSLANEYTTTTNIDALKVNSTANSISLTEPSGGTYLNFVMKFSNFVKNNSNNDAFRIIGWLYRYTDPLQSEVVYEVWNDTLGQWEEFQYSDSMFYYDSVYHRHTFCTYNINSDYIDSNGDVYIKTYIQSGSTSITSLSQFYLRFQDGRLNF